MNQKSFRELIKELIRIKDGKLMENFLLGLLTANELDDIPRRIQIVKMLKAGIPQQTISKNLGVGIATVTRGSKELKLGRFKNL